MNTKVLHTVEFDKIIDLLTEKADSEPGKKLCRELLPMNSLADIERAQRQTADAAACIFRKGSISFGSNRDFSFTFGALSIGSSLTAPELLHLSSFLNNVQRAQSYGLSEAPNQLPPIVPAASPEDEEGEDSLFDLFDTLCPLPHISSEIRRCIISEEEIADDASSELRRIRRAIGQTNDKVHAQLSKMVNSTHTNYLQDAVITMRGNRYCIPVKTEYKSQVPGIVHDQSGSGSTLFIEPTAVVELNNTLRELLLQEKKEEERILAEISAQAAAHIFELEANARTMTQLDFIFAKASLAMDMNATRPIMNDRHYIHIRCGRHPLIDPKKVVPIEFSIGDTYDMIIITGPNTGGKTVTLKTAGLFELMGMSGLHIPAADRSELSLFRDIFADIGDEQSIEQSLSTFSSHMTSIVDILRRVDRDCLCLFDELGAGTDPAEGAALAISILNFLHVRKIRTMATTHYTELKVYALRTDGIENASCEFNVDTLQPTYRLIMGIPGKSNAFAISKKLGLPGYIIETAREQLSQETQNFEDLLAELEENRKQAQKEKEEAEAVRLRIQRDEKALRDREKQLDEKRDKIIQKANEQAREILEDAKKKADEAISDMRKLGKTGDMKSMEHTRSALREQISSKNKKLQKKKAPAPKGKLKASDLHVGDKVRINSMGLTGYITSLPDRSGKVGVRCGIMNSKADLTDLSLIHEDAFGNTTQGKASSSYSLKKAFSQKGSSAGSSQVNISRSSGISAELNLLGMTTVDAIQELDKYLDDCRLSHLSSVRIVHGKGTGALRNAVQNYLRKQKWIKSYRAGDFGEGDAGVTIVELND
ncbi:MAG: endonuclease MutS2 [Lachnospiraceae bacterium]|nr:endonuclease MutS2 [Lachnospiraceae bacterium]